VFVQAFGDVVRELKLGGLFLANQVGASLPDNSGELDPLEGPAGQANQMAFSPDGRRALFASADRSVVLWDVDANRELKRFVGHSASVWSVALSADGTRALSGGMDGTARLWDAATGRELLKLDGHVSLVSAVAFAPDGKRAVTGGFDGSAVLWDLDSGKEVARSDGAFRYVNAVAVSPDGRQALIAADRMVHIWDLDGRKIVGTLEGHAGSVSAVAYTAGGKQALTGSDDRTAKLWDLSTGKVVQTFAGHAGYVRSVAATSDGRWALTGAADQTVRLWQASTGQELGAFAKHTEPVVQAVFADGGRRTLSGSTDSAVRGWDLAKFNPTPDQPAVESPAAVETPKAVLGPSATYPVNGNVGALFLSPNRKWLYALNLAESNLLQFDPATLKRTRELKLADGCEVVTRSPDGKAIYALAVADGATRVQVIDPVALTVRKAFDIDFAAYDVAAGDGGLLYLSGSGGGWTELAQVDAEKGTVAARWGGVWNNSFLKLSADRKRLYAGTQGVNPGKIDGFVLPSRVGDRAESYGVPASPDYPLGGDFLLTPDGQHLIAKTGTVLQLSPDRTSDLKPTAKLPRFLAATVDVDGGTLLVVTPAGWLNRYEYPSFRALDSYPLGVTAYQAAFDAAEGRLYLAVADPKALRDRPRAKGLGDLWAVDLKPITASRSATR
jgi:WD40 repeat protein